jgi:hypothetical protein
MGCSASVPIASSDKESPFGFTNSLPLFNDGVEGNTPPDANAPDSYNMRDDLEKDAGNRRAGWKLSSKNTGFSRDTYSHSSIVKIQLKKLVMFVNPVSGNPALTRRTKDKVVDIFKEAGIETIVEETKHAKHIIELVRDYDLTNIDSFVVLGGDGTLHEAVNGLMMRADKMKIPIGE